MCPNHFLLYSCQMYQNVHASGVNADVRTHKHTKRDRKREKGNNKQTRLRCSSKIIHPILILINAHTTVFVSLCLCAPSPAPCLFFFFLTLPRDGRPSSFTHTQKKNQRRLFSHDAPTTTRSRPQMVLKIFTYGQNCPSHAPQISKHTQTIQKKPTLLINSHALTRPHSPTD